MWDSQSHKGRPIFGGWHKSSPNGSCGIGFTGFTTFVKFKMEEAWNSIVRWGPLWSKLSSKHVKTLTIPTCCISRPQLTPTNATNASTHRPTPCIGKHSKLQRLQHFESFQRPPATIIPFLGLPN